ncbi:serine/threonine protein kinase [Roseateles sp. BYS96W]|uniref:non-specific serine/threonine protein kinase n=1 Tax=Pelomonas nitida TaxID=3299027 RepID=A0ABW7G9C3_9BURK
MTAAPVDDVEHAMMALPKGTRFGELEILGTLGVGGFGIVYLAVDHALEREIAIKEYMPSQFAQRDGQSQVSVRSESVRETFDVGRRSFVNEARLLARFDHPSLLKVYRFWEANGTAYMAMPRLVGQSLRDARSAQTTPPPEAWVRRIFDAILGGLEALHAQNVWHRDVAPDNIFLPADGAPPILLDFGAARQAIGDRNQVFTAILKPSFAPIEQYAEATGLRQGPWTDFYALAAVTYELLTGHPPQPCTARAMSDELRPLFTPGYSPVFLAALDWALRVAPHQRPQSAAAWREVLDGQAAVPPPQAAAAASRRPPPPPPPAPAVDISFADTVQVALLEEPPNGAAVPPVVAGSAAASAPAPASVRPARRSPRRRSGLWLLRAAGFLALLLLGLIALQLRSSLTRNTTPAADVAASAVVPPPAVPVAPATSEPASATAFVLEGAASEPASAPAMAEPAASAASAASAEASALLLKGAPALRNAAVMRRDAAAARPLVIERAVETPRAAPRGPVNMAPPHAASVAAPVQPAVASVAAHGEPRTPAEACGQRVLLARTWCIDRQCAKPQYRNDPECVRLRDLRSGDSGIR